MRLELALPHRPSDGEPIYVFRERRRIRLLDVGLQKAVEKMQLGADVGDYGGLYCKQALTDLLGAKYEC